MGGEVLVKDTKVMKEILYLYTRGSRQLINWEKSLVFFINTPEDKHSKIARILGCGVGKLPSTYLGLPLGATPLDSFWNGIIDRFKRSWWGGKWLLLVKEANAF